MSEKRPPRFTAVDAMWRKFMALAVEDEQALRVAATDHLLSRFREANHFLKLIAHGLGSYLDAKRATFGGVYSPLHLGRLWVHECCRVYGHRLGGEADRQGSAPLQARPRGLYIALPSEASSALWVRHGVELVCSCDD